MERKTSAATGFTLTDQGAVDAIFARLNVKDLDGDVTLPGAFTDGAPVVISAYGHKSWSDGLPVGRGQIRMAGDEAHLEGQFFMDTTHGRDTFLTVKGLAELGQWSYGYDTLDGGPGEWQGEKVRFLRKQQVHEVSPVFLGAGIGTQTVGTKQDGGLPFSQQADEALGRLEDVLGEIAAVVSRAKSFGTEAESKAGRVLSAANRDRLQQIHGGMNDAHGSMTEMLGALSDLITATDPNKANEALRQQLLAEVARFQTIAIGGLKV